MRTVFKYTLYALLFVIVVLFINSLFVGNVTRSSEQNQTISRLGNKTGEYKMSANETVNTWDKTKETGAKAWDATKEGSAKAWDKTKEVTSDAADAVADKSRDAWKATKEGSAKAWDKTKDAVSTD